jgi:hypothetical protein
VVSRHANVPTAPQISAMPIRAERRAAADDGVSRDLAPAWKARGGPQDSRQNSKNPPQVIGAQAMGAMRE